MKTITTATAAAIIAFVAGVLITVAVMKPLYEAKLDQQAAHHREELQVYKMSESMNETRLKMAEKSRDEALEMHRKMLDIVKRYQASP